MYNTCSRCKTAPAPEGFKTCASCREYLRVYNLAHPGRQRERQRRRIQLKKSRGECIYCPTPALPSRTLCQRCKDTQATFAARRRSRLTGDRCAHCRKAPVQGGKTLCDACRGKKNQLWSIRLLFRNALWRDADARPLDVTLNVFEDAPFIVDELSIASPAPDAPDDDPRVCDFARGATRGRFYDDFQLRTRS